MHALEKILARASGEEDVRAGQIVTAKVDLTEVNDLYYQVIKSFRELGGERVAYPDRVASSSTTIPRPRRSSRLRTRCGIGSSLCSSPARLC
jgi:homoaconitase/3-isopropylmalate dehydratase large subunit